jgi:hypothetical protein
MNKILENIMIGVIAYNYVDFKRYIVDRQLVGKFFYIDSPIKIKGFEGVVHVLENNDKHDLVVEALNHRCELIFIEDWHARENNRILS